MTKQEQSEKIVYGSLITSTKCYSCIHFPLCFAQKGGANLELASENNCCYYQSKLPENSVVLSMEEFSKALTDNFNMGKKEAQFYSERVAIPTTRKETAEKWHYHITTTLLALWKDNKITTEVYNYWIVFFNGLAKQFGVEIKE